MAAPRYIDRDDVDSTIMLSAALYSYQVDRLVWDQLKLYGNLTMVVHRDSMDFESSTHAVNIVRCIPCKRGICCNRCQIAEGGYEFRWLSPIWSPMYIENARKGSWLPGKSESRVTTSESSVTVLGRGAVLIEELVCICWVSCIL